MGSGTDFKLGFKSTANNSATIASATQDQSGPALTSSPAAAAGSSGGGGGGSLSLTAGNGIALTPSTITNVGSIATVQGLVFYVDSYIASASGNILNGINAAIAALNAANTGKLVFGGGVYSFNGAVTVITCPCEVEGCYWGVTQLVQNGAHDVFSFQTANPCYIHDIYIGGSGSNTGIIFGSASTANSSSTVERVEVIGFLVGIAAANTINNFLISNCTIGCTHSIVVGGYDNAGTVVVTAGGSFAGSAAMILNSTPTGSTNGIFCLAPNGVLVFGCEFVVAGYAINCQFQNSTASMSDIWIEGNHIEGSGTGLLLDCATNAVTNGNKFNNITITGNEFGMGGYGIQCNSTVQWSLATVAIVGNVFVNCPSGCAVLTGIFGGIVTGNLFQTNGGVSNLSIGASCRYVTGAAMPNNGYIGGNGYTDSQSHNVADLQGPSGLLGSRNYVTDALSPVFGSPVVGGGAVTIPVFSDGTNWIVG